MNPSIAIAVVFAATYLTPLGTLAQESVSPEQQALHNLATVEEAFAERGSPNSQSSRREIKANEPDLEHSLDWLIQNGRAEQALRFVDAMNFFWMEFGESQESRQRFTQVLMMPSAHAPTVLRAKVLYDAGVLAFRQGDEVGSRALNEESLAIGRRLNDQPTIAMALIGQI